MAFQKDKTTIIQTATNTAGGVVAALVTGGVITDADDARTELSTIRDELFEAMTSVVDEDNKMFRHEAGEDEEDDDDDSSSKTKASKSKSKTSKSKTKKTSSKKSSSKGGKGGKKKMSLSEARDIKLKFGAFSSYDDDNDWDEENSLTLGQVFDLDESEAAEYGYGDGDKDGHDYIQWLSGNDDGPFLQKAALVIIESAQAEEDD